MQSNSNEDKSNKCLKKLMTLMLKFIIRYLPGGEDMIYTILLWL